MLLMHHLQLMMLGLEHAMGHMRQVRTCFAGVVSVLVDLFLGHFEYPEERR